jgi:hypothetical protein
MQILLDTNSVLVFAGYKEVTDQYVELTVDSFNYDYNTSNTIQIDAEPPEYPYAGLWKWENDAWVCLDPQAIENIQAAQKAAYNDQQRKNRFAAYTVESDPIFFKSQRGEATNQEWLDAIAAIDARFPYQE